MMQERAINLHGVPEKITIDKSDANTAAIESVKADACVDILMRKKNTSTTSSSRITGPSKESPNRCSVSSRFGVLESSSVESRQCT
jgi:transposase-like protein